MRGTMKELDTIQTSQGADAPLTPIGHEVPPVQTSQDADAALTPRVIAFMAEVDRELWRLGVNS